MKNTKPSYHDLEQEVKFLKEKLRNVEKLSSIGYWDWDILNNKLSCSDQVFDILGVSKENFEVTKENFDKVIYPEDIENFRAEVDKALHKGCDIELLYRIIRSNGEIRIVRSKATIICEDEIAQSAHGIIEDLTEFELTKIQLIEINSFNQQLLNNIDTAIIIIDFETKIIENANLPATKLIGASLEQIIGKKCDLILCSDCESNCPLVDYNNYIENADKFLIRPDGSYLPILKTVKKISVKGKQKLIESFIDNTQNKKTQEIITKNNAETIAAKEKAEESTKLLSLFIKHSPIFTYIKEVSPEESWVLFASENFSEMTGISGSKMEGKNMEQLFPPEFAKKITMDDWNVVCDGVTLKFDEDLNDRHYTTIKFPITLGDKKMLAGYTIDITDRVKTEQNLRENESKMRAILDAMPDMMFIQDLEGTYSDYYIPKNAITYNPPKVFLGQRIDDVLPQNVVDGFLNLIQKAINTNKIQFYEYSLQMPDGFHFYEARAIAYEANKVLSIVRDITRRYLSEQTVKKQTNELLKLNTDKDRFLSILAHDLRSPFNNILGFLDLLSKNIRIYDIDKIESILKIIANSTYKTYNLLEDILQWAKSQAGQLPFEQVKVSFMEIANQVISSIINQAKTKKIVINCFESEPTVLSADANMLKTILRNLITNAIKFTKENGKINVYSQISGSFAIITVSDSGVGIQKEDQDKIWDISSEFSTKGTAKEEGTGLGLILCQEFVEKHGGKIWVESELGKGSDFKFKIPLYQI
jgi:PAS domain S-box-containing protein